MKHIMISIKPEWVEKILKGEKTLEIRKSFPKCILNGEECIVEIYCTKNPKKLLDIFKKGDLIWSDDEGSGRFDENVFVKDDWFSIADERHKWLGKVVARWYLKKCSTIDICDPDILLNGKQVYPYYFEDYACLTIGKLMKYVGCGFDNGWSKEFDRAYAWHIDNLEIYDKPKELAEFGLKRPPQSWQYLEDLKGENN